MISDISDIIKSEGDSHKWLYRGFNCEIERNPYLGVWIGYVYIPEDSAVYKESLDEIVCHGGITYMDLIQNDFTKIYKIGFDCAHYTDFCPKFGLTLGQSISSNSLEISYKNKEFAMNECKSIVDQIYEIKSFMRNSILSNILN